MTTLRSLVASFGRSAVVAASCLGAGVGSAQPMTFTHLAGSLGAGWFDGTGSEARFDSPMGVTVDGSGNVYVADAGNHTIRKVTSSGAVTTLAGLAGSFGSAEGTGSGARFAHPSGVAVDASGNVYVADEDNHTIRMVTPSGVVTTMAGLAGSLGSVDGTGSGARFNNPSGVAVDASGNVYVADQGNSTIRKVTASGVVTTLAGRVGTAGSADGTGSEARFQVPHGIAVDGSGNVYVTDECDRLRRVTPAGVVTTLTAGSACAHDDGPPGDVPLHSYGGVAVDGSGNVYVAGWAAHTIRKVTPSGVVTTVAGLAGSLGSANGTGSEARFNFPSGVAADGSGNVYVADQYNNTIRKVTSSGLVSTVAGVAGGWGSADGTGSGARFNDPEGVAVDASGNVYVADTRNHTVRKVTASGVVTTLAGLVGSLGSADGTGSGARFSLPTGVAVDGSGNVYVADQYNHTIRKVTPSGVVTTLAGLPGSSGRADGTGSEARFSSPGAVAVSGSGIVYVADQFNYAIRKVTASGVVTTLVGLLEGPPVGVAVDGSGNVYVADAQHHTIRKVTAAGVVTTLAGLAVSPGSVDGTGSGARFRSPTGLAVDGTGSVYVADSGNSSIRKVTASGEVTTVAGLAETWGNADGTGSAARFYHPSGVAVDGFGNVYVADENNDCIRKGTAALPDAATIDSPTGSTGSVRHLGSSPRTASSWLWEVVRRPADSTAQLSAADVAKPTFAPDRPDLYTFRLTASDGVRSSLSMVDLMATSAAPSASFSWSPSSPVSGQPVQFTDTSGGSPLSWVWSFADGDSSTLRNPSHVFASPGTYPVSLLVTNENGSSTVGRLLTVTLGGGTSIDFTVSDASSGLPLPSLGEGYEASAGQLLRFSATGAIGAVSWDFGDGTSSVEASPVKSFAPVDDTSYVVSVSRGGESRQRPLMVKAPGVPPDPLLWVAAGMAWADGMSGELWQSDLSIYNPATQPARYSLAFVSGTGWEGATNAAWSTLEVGAGETRAFPNILANHFGRARGAWGVVLVRGDSAPVSPVIVSRTYNAADADVKGTFGLSVPAMWVGEGVRPQSNAASSFLADLRHDASYRTNLTVANLKDQAAEVEVVFRDESGTVLGSPARVIVEARGVKQLNGALPAAPATGDTPIGGAGYADPVSHFSAEVNLIRGAGVYPFATVIDQGTGDSIVVTPAVRPSATYRLPGIVRVKGKTGSWWMSDVAVQNPGTSARRILVSYSYVKLGTASRVEVSNILSLSARQLWVSVDFVRNWLGLAAEDPDGYASSWVDFAPAPDDPAPSEPIVVTGKTYSPSGAGSAGLQVDAFVPEDGLSALGSRRELVLSGLDANARYRTNLALFLTPGSTGSVQVNVHVLDVLGREMKRFPGVSLDASNPFVQLSSADLFETLTTDESSRATVVIDTPRGSGFVGAYATVIDNLSEDAVFVARQPAP